MKKLILLLPAIFLMLQIAIAQKPDQAIALVHYTFSHIRDTTNRANVYTENMELLLAKNASVYRSADKSLQDEQIKKQVTEQIMNGATGNIQVNLGKGRTTGAEFYQFQAEKKLVRQEKIINTYLVEESLPIINWKITADTASFGSLKCQKATTTFRGRTYEAWFCSALPFHSGPWKLSGLPGLIVEASDSKKEVVWKFAGLEDASKIIEKSVALAEANTNADKVARIVGIGEDKESSKTIALPQNGIKATGKEFAQLKETMRKDPMAFMQAAVAGSGANIKVTSAPSSTIAPVKNPINNPIELSEKP